MHLQVAVIFMSNIIPHKLTYLPVFASVLCVSDCFLPSVSPTQPAETFPTHVLLPKHLASVSSPVWLQVVQQKVNHVGSSLQDESSKPGTPTAVAWQQQRLHLLPVTALASSPNSRSSSPCDIHTADVAVDTLQQQRAKLKPVQTSKHAKLPVKQPAAAPLRGQGTAAAAYPSFVKATTTRPAAPSQGMSACSLSNLPLSPIYQCCAHRVRTKPCCLMLPSLKQPASMAAVETEPITLQCLYGLRVT